jgi:hypothetical protein
MLRAGDFPLALHWDVFYPKIFDEECRSFIVDNMHRARSIKVRWHENNCYHNELGIPFDLAAFSTMVQDLPFLEGIDLYLCLLKAVKISHLPPIYCPRLQHLSLGYFYILLRSNVLSTLIISYRGDEDYPSSL